MLASFSPSPVKRSHANFMSADYPPKLLHEVCHPGYLFLPRSQAMLCDRFASRRWAFGALLVPLLALGCLFAVVNRPVLAQKEKGGDDEDKRVWLFSLKHVSAVEAAKILKELF